MDHHLRWGNSLIGAFDLADIVAVGSKRWETILEAATNMVNVSKSSDSTVAQVGQSKADYREAQAKLEGVKRYANVPIAAYFVDKLNEYRKSKKNSNVIPQIAQIAYGVSRAPTCKRCLSAHRKLHWITAFSTGNWNSPKCLST